MFFVSSTLPDELPYTEKYYGTKYQLEPMDDNFLNDLASPGDNDEFSLPEKNIFIPDNFDVGPLSENPLRNLSLLKHTNLMELWHKRDDQFQIPWTDMRFKLCSPLCSNSLENYMKVRFLSRFIYNNSRTRLCSSEGVGYSFSINSSTHGIAVGISGFSGKIHLLLDTIMAQFRTFKVDSARFQNFKKGFIDNLRNSKYNSPYALVDTHHDYLMCPSEWTIEEEIRTTEALQESDMNQFIKDFPKNLFIIGLVCGSLTTSDALNLAQSVEILLQYEPASQIRTTYNMIPNDTSYFQHPTYNPTEVNSAIQYICQMGYASEPRDRANIRIIEKLIKEPLESKLRTEQQLGYQVDSGIWIRSTISGLSIKILGERPAHFLESRIEAFLMKFEKEIENMAEGDFENIKQAVIYQLLTPATTISGEFAKFYIEIFTLNYDFLEYETTADYVKNISKAEVLEFYRKTMLPTSNKRRVLSCQVISQCCKGEDSANVELRNLLSTHSIVMEEQKYHDLANTLSQLEQNERLHSLLKYIKLGGFDSSSLDECSKRLENLLSSTTLSLNDVPKIKRVQILDAQAYRNAQAKAPLIKSVFPIENFIDMIEATTS